MLKPILFVFSLFRSSALPAPWHKPFWKPLLSLSSIFSCASDSFQECREKFQNQQFYLGEFIGKGMHNRVGKVEGTDFVYKKAYTPEYLSYKKTYQERDEDNLYNFHRMTGIYGLNKPVCYINPKSESDNIAFVYHKIIPFEEFPYELTRPYFKKRAIQDVFRLLLEWQYQREGLKMSDYDVKIGHNVGISFAGEPIYYDLDRVTWSEKWEFDAQKEADAARQLSAALRNSDWQEFLEKMREHKKLEKWEKSGRFKKFNLF